MCVGRLIATFAVSRRSNLVHFEIHIYRSLAVVLILQAEIELGASCCKLRYQSLDIIV